MDNKNKFYNVDRRDKEKIADRLSKEAEALTFKQNCIEAGKKPELKFNYFFSDLDTRYNIRKVQTLIMVYPYPISKELSKEIEKAVNIVFQNIIKA